VATALTVKSTPHRLFWHDGAHGALTFLHTGHCQPCCLIGSELCDAQPPNGAHMPGVWQGCMVLRQMVSDVIVSLHLLSW
jgi:hypothetical protein